MSNYPTYLHTGTAGVPVTSVVIDILAAYQERMPPVLHLDVEGGSATYKVQGSHDMTRWHDYYSGNAAQLERDLIPGVRFWRVPISANTGRVYASVGPVPDRNGNNVTPAIVVPNVYPVP